MPPPPKPPPSNIQNDVVPTKPENRYKATWAHQGRFAAGCAALLISLAKLIILISKMPLAPPRPWIHLALAGVLGYLLADLASGIVHWALDNYGTPQTPFVGPQIEAFLRHHSHPSEITRCDTARHANTVAAGSASAMAALNLFSGNPAVLAFALVFATCGVFSAKFHAWAHSPRNSLPPLVAALQWAGVLLGPSRHGPHHWPPYSRSYCTVSGIWNRALDKSKVLTLLEILVFYLTGVKPRSWSQ